MKTRTFRRVLASTVFAGVLTVAGVASADGPIKTEKNAGFTMSDPTGDDDGPGTYKYPTDAVYKPGSFDIVEFQVVPGGSTTEFRIKVNAKIEDPWDSQAWGGNGFSIQMVFIHIDTDHKAGSGVLDGLPGTNVRFNPDEAWDRAVIISPQGAIRVNSEIDQKCPQWKDRIVVPRVTRALMFSSNSVQAPLWPPMLSTQNGLEIDRQPCVLSFWYMYFVYKCPFRSKLTVSARTAGATARSPTAATKRVARVIWRTGRPSGRLPDPTASRRWSPPCCTSTGSRAASAPDRRRAAR